MKIYTVLDRQSIFDICLNTYGSLDFLIKLMSDNNFPGCDNYPVAGDAFLYDDSLIVNQTTVTTSSVIQAYCTRNTGVQYVNVDPNQVNSVTQYKYPQLSTSLPLYQGIIDKINTNAGTYQDNLNPANDIIQDTLTGYSDNLYDTL